jgi:hypothetical protein
MSTVLVALVPLVLLGGLALGWALMIAAQRGED